MTTAFLWDDRCFWHGGGAYALTMPVGGFVQPLPAGLPENPETKRRLRNLIEVSGLAREMTLTTAPPATWDEMARVHPEAYLTAFKAASVGALAGVLDYSEVPLVLVDYIGNPASCISPANWTRLTTS